ncbi:uncharacterized protein [Eucyclogobius newberryi]|uniref:uncharacterized protein n=1 Tax=Eucyclogobius newberryi TaxID=166745 RepID=UPI003B5B96ED
MSEKRCTLRALVNARLTAAAEEIFALVERTIAEYEEELCRSKEENQRNQQLLDSVLSPQVLAPRAGVQIRAASPEEAGQRLTGKHVEFASIKDEPEDFCFVQPGCVKGEVESLALEQQHHEDTPREPAPREPAPREPAHCTPEPFTLKSTEGGRVWSTFWDPPASSSTAQMETEADGDHDNQVQIKDTSTAAHNSGLFSKYKCGAESRATVTEGHGSGTGAEGGGVTEVHLEQKEPEGNHYSHVQIKDSGANVSGLFGFRSPSENMTLYLGHAKVHECSFCEKRFSTNQSLQIHIRVHTGEKPYSCPFCKKCFTQKAHLKTHIRTHTKEKPYRCSVCLKSFMHKVSLNLHMEKTHPEFVGPLVKRRRRRKMCERSLALRALVNARLTAAAEEIFALVERTIVEYEEELCRSKEENQRNQQLLDSVLSLRAEGVQTDWCSPDLVSEETPETAQIKEEPEEHLLKQEEEQLPEFTAVCVKSEEQSSLLQQRQPEHRELTQREHCGGAGADISLDPHGHLHSQTEEQTDNDEDWEPQASSSTAQMETEADGDHYNQVQIKDTSTAAHNSALFSKYKCGAESRATVTEGHGSGTGAEVGGGKAGGGGGGYKKHECSVCEKRFSFKKTLERHIRTHTGEKPYSCSFCKKGFARQSTLDYHVRLHTGERPYGCSVCNKTFVIKSNLNVHMRIHTAEKRLSCDICTKTFNLKGNLNKHMRTHTGEKPYSCSVCKKTFAQKWHLKRHLKSHTEERPSSSF